MELCHLLQLNWDTRFPTGNHLQSPSYLHLEAGAYSIEEYSFSVKHSCSELSFLKKFGFLRLENSRGCLRTEGREYSKLIYSWACKPTLTPLKEDLGVSHLFRAKAYNGIIIFEWIRADHYIQMIFQKSMTGWISSCPTAVLWLQPMLFIHLFLFTCYIMNALLCSPPSLAEGMKTKFPLSKCLHWGCCRKLGLENFGLASVCLGREGCEYIPSKSERLWEVYLTPNNHSNQDKNSWNCNLQMALFPVSPCKGVMQLRRITWRRKTMANLNRDHQVKSIHNSWNQNELICCATGGFSLTLTEVEWPSVGSTVFWYFKEKPYSYRSNCFVHHCQVRVISSGIQWEGCYGCYELHLQAPVSQNGKAIAITVNFTPSLIE